MKLKSRSGRAWRSARTGRVDHALRRGEFHHDDRRGDRSRCVLLRNGVRRRRRHSTGAKATETAWHMLGRAVVGRAGRGLLAFEAAQHQQRTLRGRRGHRGHAEGMEHDQVRRKDRKEAVDRPTLHKSMMQQLWSICERANASRNAAGLT